MTPVFVIDQSDRSIDLDLKLREKQDLEVVEKQENFESEVIIKSNLNEKDQLD